MKKLVGILWLLGATLSSSVYAEVVELTFNSKILVYSTDSIEDSGSVSRNFSERTVFTSFEESRQKGKRSFETTKHQSLIEGRFRLNRDIYTGRKNLSVSASWSPEEGVRCAVNKAFDMSSLPADFSVSEKEGCSFYVSVKKVGNQVSPNN